jgi:ATP-binding cassette subfamily B protein
MQGSSSARRMREILAEGADRNPPHETVSTEPVGLRHAIELRGVTFRYGDLTVLENVSLSIAAGQSVAFVGRSGSGKSTLVSLLMRVYDPASGTIAIDGRDMRTIAPSAVRAQIGVVFQSSFLFNATVRENIRLGRMDATDADVETAARAAQVHDFLVELPLGYDTVVGEGGSILSGGQQQRIALARAIVRRPRILIMDEATSALDPATEAAVNATLGELSADRTLIAVTHRLTSVMDMDHVYVFDKGHLVEEGPPSDLLARGGTFASLWQKQNSFSVNATGTHARLDSLFLRTIPIFADVEDARLDALADAFRSEFHEGGARLITRGEPGEIFYIIVRGRVEVLGTQGAAWILEDGDFFGEIALLADVPRTATVNTLERCLFLTLHRDQFRALLQNDAGLRAAFERVMQQRLEQPAAH